MPSTEDQFLLNSQGDFPPVHHAGAAPSPAPPARENLGRHALRGGTAVLAAEIAGAALQVVSVVVLARLLPPADFGLVGMVASSLAFLRIFQDLGLSTAAVQQRDLTAEQANALFWINAGAGLAIALLTLAVSPALAWFFHDSRLLPVSAAMSVPFLIAGLGIQPRVALTREMRFITLACIDVASALAGLLSAIALAFAGASYWALVAMPLVSSTIATAAYLVAARWKPAFPRNWSGAHSVLRFGAGVTFANITIAVTREADKVLIGRWWGAEALGLYTRAYALFIMPLARITWPIASIAVPILSRLQADLPRFRAYYLNAIAITTFLAVPLGAFLFVTADDIILLSLGPAWHDAIPIFRMLAISIPVQPLYTSVSWVYTARGLTRGLVKWSGVGAVLIICSFALGLPGGPERVALYYAICIWLLPWFGLPPGLAGTHTSLLDVARACLPNYAAALVGAAVVWFLRNRLLPSLPVAPSLALGLVVMAGIYVATVFFVFGKGSLYLNLARSFRHRD